MPFIVKRPNGTWSEHECYAPALAEARLLAGSKIVYEGVRGLTALVWPLTPPQPSADGGYL